MKLCTSSPFRKMIHLVTLAGLFLASGVHAAHWPQFRGPHGLGIAEGTPPPTHFGPDSNVLWKTELPAGHSSPCVWSNQIFLTGYNGQKLETLSLDRMTGTVLWRELV